MTREHKTYKDYWDEVAMTINVGDTITCDVDDDNNTIIIFKNESGCVLNTYFAEKEEVIYY